MLTVKRLLTPLLVVTIMFIATSASAQTGVEGGSGLFFVDKAKTLGSSNFTVGGFLLSANYDEALVDIDESMIAFPVTLGISDNFEVSAYLASTNIDRKGFGSVDGMKDGLVKLKWNFRNSEKHRLRFSAIGLVSFPLGDEDKGLGTGDTDLGIKLAIDKEYNNVTWHFNGGFMSHSSDKLDSAFLYGAGFEWYALESLSVLGEVSGQSWTAMAPWRDDNTVSTGGIRYYINDWASVSLAYSSWGGGSGARSPNMMWTAGINLGRGISKQRPEARDRSAEKEPVVVKPKPIEKEAAPKVIKIILEGIHFKFDKSELTDKAKEILKMNAEKLKANPGTKVIVEGHTCSIGANGYNQKLGLRRAKSAKVYLVKQMGVHPDTMFVLTSFGEERPAHTNETREGRRLNRRVDFIIQSR